jgi:hypothetical protein
MNVMFPSYLLNQKHDSILLISKSSKMECRKAPYPWKDSFAKKSPFRTLKNAKAADRRLKAGKSIGFTATASLKSQGRLPRANGCYVLGAKYGSGNRTRKTRR